MTKQVINILQEVNSLAKELSDKFDKFLRRKITKGNDNTGSDSSDYCTSRNFLSSSILKCELNFLFISFYIFIFILHKMFKYVTRLVIINGNNMQVK